MNRRIQITKCSNCNQYFKMIFEDTQPNGDRGIIYIYGADEQESKESVEDGEYNLICPYCKLLEQ